MIKFTSKLKDVQKALKDAELKGITEACLLVEGQAKALTPVDTGQLRASITHRTEGLFGRTIGEVGTPVEYSPHVEFGTMYQKEQPYLRPAFRENKDKIQKILAGNLKEGMGND